MKSTNRSNYVIALGVILCSAALLAALTYALAGIQWRAGGRTLSVEFHDATGIRPHSPVKMAGKNAGYVREIHFLTAEERLQAKDPLNAIRLVLHLNDDVPDLPEDTQATLAAETLLGEKFVALIPGRPDSRPLANAAVIQGTEVSSIDAVARSAQMAIQNVNDIILSFKADYPALVPRVADLLNQGNSILRQGSNLVNNADGAIVNANSALNQLKADYTELIPRLTNLFAHAQSIATNADHAVLKLGGLIERLDAVVATNETELASIIGELRVTSQNLKVLTTYAKSLTGTLAERPSNLIWGRRRKELPGEREILESKEPVLTR